MPFHAEQSVAALERGIHVLSEVPAGVSVDECKDLVRACRESSATYMMAENYTYARSNQIVKEMVRRGEFGKPYYAEGEYLHELKWLHEVTPWRRTWQSGVNGVTYGTHSLGPVLQWMPGDRVERVCGAGSGRNHVDPRGDGYENEASSVMLCQMRSGGLVKVRVDMISDRPHAAINYQLQGTDGCYESARAPGEKDRVWLRSHDTKNAGIGPYEQATFERTDLEELAEEFMPESWRTHGEQAAKSGHGGGDLLELIDFMDAIEHGAEPVIGIHEAMDMTLPGLISQQSIADGGRWLEVPDSREW
jgi:predicted dehydrogenase